MHYMLIMLETGEAMRGRSDPEKAPAYWAGWMAYAQAVREAGIMVGGNGLEPPATATTVRLRDGRRQVEDGPFAETKEMIGGYFVIDVPDLDAALAWAARAPAASSGAVEIRPCLPPPPQG
jgi:hypothetical protein